MQVTAKIISDLLQGTIEGDPNVVVSKPSKIEEGQPGTITFLANKKYESYAYTTKASILLVSHDFQPKQPISATLIRVKDVYAAITFLLEQFNQQQNPKPQGKIDSLAFVGNTAKIGEEVTIGAFAYISNTATIGNNVIIHPHTFVGEGVSIGDNTIIQVGVKILKDCKVGENCIIHPNAVIGSDGFGYRPQKDGSYKKVPQLGNVVIGNDVEIGTNTVIDRAVMGSTVIKDGVKLDNLIQVAHNVEIGKNTAIAAQAGVAGSAVIGENCIVGGQAGIVGHIKVADGSKIQAQSGVATSIKDANKAWYGSPAFAYSGFLRSQVWFQKLPQLEKRIRMLEKQLKEKKG